MSASAAAEDVTSAISSLSCEDDGSTQRKFEQFMLLTVGLPGSGNSTFASSLETAMPWKYVRIDVKKQKKRKQQKFKEKIREVLEEGKCPVIDRWNFDRAQREEYSDIAGTVPVECVVFDYDEQECIRRALARGSVSYTDVNRDISRVLKQFDPPRDNNNEGFRRVLTVRDDVEVERVLREYVDAAYLSALSVVKDVTSAISTPSGEVNSPTQHEFEQFMLLTVGLPGSGKSTFASKLETAMPWKYVRINQDEIKKRDRCEKKARKVLLEGKCPIIDRCNFDKAQRKKFIDIAVDVRVPVECVVFDYEKQECIRRAQARSSHPTVLPSEARKVVAMVSSQFHPPRANNKEGIRRVHTVRDDVEFDHVLREYLDAGVEG